VTEFEKYMQNVPALEWDGRPLQNNALSCVRDGSFIDYRSEAIKRFGFAILTDAAVQGLLRYSPLLEVGAGACYWAHELRAAGADIIATDPDPLSCVSFELERMWLEPERLTALQAIAKYPKRTLMMVWPSLRDSWAHDALKAYEGEHVIYCGEGWGGCTADDAFHELLDRDWVEERNFDIPSWFGINDYCCAYRRKIL
jgi:hypothetical protein